ncbi:hypothetical protein Droror1_Dr00000706 [Drosera rotundifolia]
MTTVDSDGDDDLRSDDKLGGGVKLGCDDGEQRRVEQGGQGGVGKVEEKKGGDEKPPLTYSKPHFPSAHIHFTEPFSSKLHLNPPPRRRRSQLCPASTPPLPSSSNSPSASLSHHAGVAPLSTGSHSSFAVSLRVPLLPFFSPSFLASGAAGNRHGKQRRLCAVAGVMGMAALLEPSRKGATVLGIDREGGSVWWLLTSASGGGWGFGDGVVVWWWMGLVKGFLVFFFRLGALCVGGFLAVLLIPATSSG